MSKKPKLQLEQCAVCKKTFSAHDGSIKDKICDTCKTNRQKEADRLQVMEKIKENLRNKPKKKSPKRREKSMEKLAKVVS